MRLFSQQIILLPQHQIGLLLLFETLVFALNIFLQINYELLHLNDSNIQLLKHFILFIFRLHFLLELLVLLLLIDHILLLLY